MDCFSFGLILTALVALLVWLFWLANSTSPSTSKGGSVRRAGSARSRAGSNQARRRPLRDSSPASAPEPVDADAAERLAQQGNLLWVPHGQHRSIQGYSIPGGMIYVGRTLSAVSRWGPGTEPALISSHLTVDRTHPDRAGSLMSYWPGYHSIPPASRAAYLEWLAGGRQDPEIGIGYVFLFFYGLERRLLLDARCLEGARAEAPFLLAEVERLLTLYGHNASFRGYATALLEVARLVGKPLTFEDLRVPEPGTTWEVPLSVKLALGILSRGGKPIPAEWALAWAKSSPAIRLRTPASRCRREFDELFSMRYTAAFQGGGLRVPPNKTKLTLQYRAASAGLQGVVDLRLPDLPDITSLTGPLTKLQKVVEEVSQELDAFSRHVGRTGEQESPAALSLLPAELAATRDSPEARPLLAWLNHAFDNRPTFAAPVAELLALWPNGEKLGKREALQLSAFLAQRGIGFEPDSRFGAPPLVRAQQVVLFRLDDANSDRRTQNTELLGGARLLLELTAAVSAADGTVDDREQQHLEQCLQDHEGLSSADRVRLRAFVDWLLLEKPTLGNLKSKLELLSDSQKRQLIALLLATATADGKISSEEIQALERIYPWLGRPRDQVYSDLHNLATSEPAAAEPVLVQRANTSTSGTPIPPQAPTLSLDPVRLARLREESGEAIRLLSGIFSEEEDSAAPLAAPGTLAPGGESLPLPGLDVQHGLFLSRLLEKESWDSAEIERLAAELDLLPDGALEVINEAALEHLGQPILEGDEKVYVDRALLEEVRE